MARNLIDMAEAAELTGLSQRALRQRRYDGQEPLSFRLGRKIVYDKSEVLAWVERQHAEGARRVYGDDATLDARQVSWLERNLASAPELDERQRDLIQRLLGTPVEERRGDTGVA